jgi:hypothetical protein
MSNLLNTGKRGIGWGATMILLGAFCMLFEFLGFGSFMAFVGLGLLAGGVLFLLTGSVILCIAASPWKTILFGGGEAAIALIVTTIFFELDGNERGPMAPIVFFLAICGLIGSACCLVGLIRVALDRRTRRIA